MSTKYFRNFPSLSYTFIGNDGEPESKRMRNLFIRYSINGSESFYPYDVSPGERIDNLADKYYDDSHAYWVIALSNGSDINDLYNDMPMSNSAFHRYLHRKYSEQLGTNTVNETVHECYRTVAYYVDADGDVVNEKDSVKSVSIHEHESQLNEDRRSIRLLDDTSLSTVVTRFSKGMSKNNE